VSLADVERDALRAEHASCDERAIEDQVGSCRHQQAVLLALRLAFRTVDQNDRAPARRGNCPPFGSNWESGATAAGKPGSGKRVEEIWADIRKGFKAIRG
jgi:hypothetical protein